MLDLWYVKLACVGWVCVPTEDEYAWNITQNANLRLKIYIAIYYIAIDETSLSIFNNNKKVIDPWGINKAYTNDDSVHVNTIGINIK